MEFSKFEERIGVVFKDKDILKQAFTHRSYINENKKLKIGHNERLEFLGDAVLELVVTDYLYNEFPNKTEGDMTAYRSSLVNSITLSNVSSRLGMNDYLLLSKGESKDTGRARQFILANTFESVVGAIYVDQGYEIAEKFIETNLFPEMKEVLKNKSWIDAKSLFQEKAQEHEGVTPQYKTVKEAGPDHDKHFHVGVYLGQKEIARGEGKSKQDAEQLAARAALEKKNWN